MAAMTTRRRFRLGRSLCAQRLAAVALAACLTLTVPTAPGLSASRGVPFSVNLADRQYCMINVLQTPGTMTSNPGLTRLSSKLPGGLPGMADVRTTNGSYDLSIDQPITFTAMPTGGDTNTVFTATMTGLSFSGSGSGTFGETTAKTSLKKGLTTVMVHLTVDKTIGTFPAGNYTSVVTLRCE